MTPPSDPERGLAGEDFSCPRRGAMGRAASRRHQGDVAVAQLADGGLRAVTLGEQTRKRKQKGLCPTCGEVKTHKPGLWKTKMPLTVEGRVYKGICLVCNTLDYAKMLLCEPIDRPADMDATVSVGTASSRPSIFSREWPKNARPGVEGPPADTPPNPQDSVVTHDGPAARDVPASVTVALAPGPPRPSPPASTFSSPRLLPPPPPPHGKSPSARRDRASPAKRHVEDFRCRDADGRPGFYTGTVREDSGLPQGRGEMAYDDGVVAKGMWTDGVLKVKVRPPREARRPRRLPGYSVGDRARREDVGSASREEAVAAVARLHVGDCAWIRRSDGTWSYAIVKSRSDGDDESVTFLVNAQGSTKTAFKKQWADHVRLPATPDVLEHYSPGNPGRDEDMIVCSREETVKSMSIIRIGDGAFVKRSDGSWAYAIVKNRTYGDGDGEEATITFQVNERGAVKVMQLSLCGKFVRRIRHNEEAGISEERAKAIFDAINAGQHEP